VQEWGTNDDKCTESSDGKHTYWWINKHTRRRASEQTPRSGTISSPSIRRRSNIPANPQQKRWYAKRAWSMPNKCKYGYRSSSERDSEWLQFGYWRSSKRDTEWRTEGWRNYCRRTYRTECQSTLPEAYQMTTEKQRDILPKLPTEMATERSRKNAPKLSSNWLSPRSSPPRLYRMRNQEIARSANSMYKAGFPEQKRSCYIVSMTYRDVNVLELDQWYDIPPTPDATGVNSATSEWSPRVLYANHNYDTRSSSSDHCPQSRRDRRGDLLFHHHYPGQFRWWSMPRINIEQANIRDGRILMTGNLNRNQSRTELPVKSQRLQWQSRITITLLLSHDGNRQSILRRSCWRSTEFSKEGDSRLRQVKSYLVLGTGPNSRVRSGSGSTRNRTVATGLTTRKTLTFGNGQVLPPKTWQFMVTILVPIKYLSFDCIMTWSVPTLCSFSCSFTSLGRICNWSNHGWAAIEKLQISHTMSCDFTVIQRMLVRSQICHRAVEERVKLHNLFTEHFMIHWDLRYLIGTRVRGTGRWTHDLGTTKPKNLWLMSTPGNEPGKTKLVRFLVGSGPDLGFFPGPNPDLLLTPLLLTSWLATCRQSTETCTEKSTAKSYRQGESVVRGSLLRHVPRSWPRLYWSHQSRAQPWYRQDGHWKTPGVSERMWSVNLDASISGEYQTLGGHCGRPSEYLGSLMTGTGVPWEWLR